MLAQAGCKVYGFKRQGLVPKQRPAALSLSRLFARAELTQLKSAYSGNRRTYWWELNIPAPGNSAAVAMHDNQPLKGLRLLYCNMVGCADNLSHVCGIGENCKE